MIWLVGIFRFKWTYLIAGAVFIAIGAGVYASAHAAAPIEIDGTIADYTEYTQSGAYDHNELKLANDSTTYTLDKTGFHPALPDSLYKDGKVSLWVDQGSSTVIALTLYDANDQNPVKYTTDHYDNPSSERSDAQSAGIVLGVFGAILLAIFVLWFALGRASSRRPAAAQVTGAGGSLPVPVPVSASPATPGAAGGLSADGRWFWEGGQWRQVSADGRYWWDGAKWQDAGAVPTAGGGTPPAG